jgi:GTPase SAR1 family protein
MFILIMPKTRNQKDTEDNGDLTVKSIIPLEIEDDDYNPVLPSIKRNSGSLILLVGTTNSGKTTLINNLLLNKNMWGRRPNQPQGAFENVSIFSPSLYLDDSCRFLVENFDCYSSFQDEIIEQMKARQLALPKDKRPKQMIVIDDSVGLIERNSSVNYLGTRYRHFNCNMIMSVQSFRACSPIMRVNANCVILMSGIMNSRELEKIDEEYGDIYKRTLLYCYAKFASKKYEFIYLKCRENPPEMYKNFTEQIDYNKYKKIGKKFKIDDFSESENEDNEDI